MTRHLLNLPWPAPPLNLNDRTNRFDKAKATKEVREAVGWIATGARLGTHDRVRVTLHYRPANKIRRDEDNLVGTYKPCCDGLVDAKVVIDDTPAHMVKRMPVLHDPDPDQPSMLWLVVEVLDDEPADVDWRRIALLLAGAPDPDFSHLSTAERDFLEAERELAS